MTTYTAPPDQTGLILNNGDVLNVNDGGIATATTINDGGLARVFSGGTATETTISGGEEDVAGNPDVGGKADFTTIDNGGRLFLEDRGRSEHTTINSGGVEIVDAGGYARDTLILSGGVLNLDGLGFGIAVAIGTTIAAGGVENVNQSGHADYTTINSGGVETVNGSHGAFGLTTAWHTTVNAGGLLDVLRGEAVDTTINDGGLVTATAGRILGTTINSGGVLDADAGVIVSSWLTFGPVDNGVGGLLKLGDPADLRLSHIAPLYNWHIGDVIDLMNTQVTSVSEKPDGRFEKVTVNYGNNQTVTYTLSGQEKNTHVAFQSDGHGGTDLILVTGVSSEAHHPLLG